MARCFRNMDLQESTNSSMELSQETEEYIRESIDQSLGLPVSIQTLQLKLIASEESNHRLKNQCFLLKSKLKEKDDIINLARGESSLNAQALKKFVDENQKLAEECANLLVQCKRWEKECSLYDRDRDALMDFANEADGRAKDAEIRVEELKEEMRLLYDEVQYFKDQCKAQTVGSSTEGTSSEQSLLESLLAAISKDEVASTARSFLEANCEVEACQRMLEAWNRLRPFTQKVIALIAEVKALEKAKEHLRINLHRAEEEVKVLFEENNVLAMENKKLRRQLHKDKRSPGSGGKQSSGTSSAKGNKRKSSHGMSSPIEKKIDFSDSDSTRQALSPLNHHCSPEAGK